MISTVSYWQTLPTSLDAQLDGWGDSRQWQITAQVLEKCGLTPGCKGCRAIEQKAQHHQAHSQACRTRIESLLEDEPEWKGRIEQSRVRKTRAEHTRNMLITEPRTIVTETSARRHEPLETIPEERDDDQPEGEHEQPEVR